MDQLERMKLQAKIKKLEHYEETNWNEWARMWNEIHSAACVAKDRLNRNPGSKEHEDRYQKALKEFWAFDKKDKEYKELRGLRIEYAKSIGFPITDLPLDLKVPPGWNRKKGQLNIFEDG